MDKKEEIKERIRANKEAIRLIKEKYIEYNSPEGYKKGTSYLDADTIHGSRKEHSLFDMVERLRLLENMIYIDTLILHNYEKEERIQDKLQHIKTTKDKVHYLRRVEGFTQEQTAEKLGITDRHVRRIEAD
ncbi:hypothetical protein K144316041_23540 [Clostridium tetani]|uniref:sigma factor-like helix-turn-helix DNA-binding protein n=1 Tax=Clostridium tetani TaxID=1513 RepID=UPI0029538A00|nr:sigma factor-like helix-turn-helix DNA-binding protein [Clostridium tetani]BDR73646.1 hypothetical protein K144316041_23540 [Clostridium tetani]